MSKPQITHCYAHVGAIQHYWRLRTSLVGECVGCLDSSKMKIDDDSRRCSNVLWYWSIDVIGRNWNVTCRYIICLALTKRWYRWTSRMNFRSSRRPASCWCGLASVLVQCLVRRIRMPICSRLHLNCRSPHTAIGWQVIIVLTKSANSSNEDCLEIYSEFMFRLRFDFILTSLRVVN